MTNEELSIYVTPLIERLREAYAEELEKELNTCRTYVTEQEHIAKISQQLLICSRTGIFGLARSDNTVADLEAKLSKTEGLLAECLERNALLEARLGKAVKLIDLAVELARWDLNPKLRDDMIDFTTDLKGESHE